MVEATCAWRRGWIRESRIMFGWRGSASGNIMSLSLRNSNVLSDNPLHQSLLRHHCSSIIEFRKRKTKMSSHTVQRQLNRNHLHTLGRTTFLSIHLGMPTRSNNHSRYLNRAPPPLDVWLRSGKFKFQPVSSLRHFVSLSFEHS